MRRVLLLCKLGHVLNHVLKEEYVWLLGGLRSRLKWAFVFFSRIHVPFSVVPDFRLGST